MATNSGVCREEFRLRHLSFNHHDNTTFYCCQWRVPHILFVLVRFILFMYTCFGFIYLAVEFPDNLMIFFTTWSYLMLTLHFGLAAFLSLLYYREPFKPSEVSCQGYAGKNSSTDNRIQNQIESSSGSKSQPVQLVWSSGNKLGHGSRSVEGIDNHSCELGELVSSEKHCNGNTKQTSSTLTKDRHNNGAVKGSSESQGHANQMMDKDQHDQGRSPNQVPTPWYFKISWILSTITSISAPIVTIIYFTTIFPNNEDNGQVGLMDTNIHVLNLVFVLIDQIISARHVRILHFYVAVIYGVTYCVFSVIYWTQDHENNVVYEIMDWNKPGMATGICVGLLLFLPLLQSAYFGLHKLKLRLSNSSK